MRNKDELDLWMRVSSRVYFQLRKRIRMTGCLEKKKVAECTLWGCMHMRLTTDIAILRDRMHVMGT